MLNELEDYFVFDTEHLDSMRWKENEKMFEMIRVKQLCKYRECFSKNVTLGECEI